MSIDMGADLGTSNQHASSSVIGRTGPGRTEPVNMALAYHAPVHSFPFIVLHYSNGAFQQNSTHKGNPSGCRGEPRVFTTPARIRSTKRSACAVAPTTRVTVPTLPGYPAIPMTPAVPAETTEPTNLTGAAGDAGSQMSEANVGPKVER